MSKHRKIVLSVIIAVAGISAIAVSIVYHALTGVSRTATSSVSMAYSPDGKLHIKTVSTRFTVVDAPRRNVSHAPGQRILLSEEFRVDRDPEAGSLTSLVKVDAWIGNGINPNKALWSISQEGEEGRVAGDFYEVRRAPQSVQHPVFAYFDLLSGHKVFSSSHESIVKAAVPAGEHAPARYITYVPDGIFLFLENQYPDNPVDALLQYRSESQAIDQISIQFRKESEIVKRRRQLPKDSWNIAGPTITLKYSDSGDRVAERMTANEKETGDSHTSPISLIISYGLNLNLVIPITNDRLDLMKATVPFFLSVKSE